MWTLGPARLVVAHAVMKTMRLRDFRTDVPETNAIGERVIMPALPDDPMGEFLDHFRAAKGTIYVAMLEADDLVILAISPAHSPRHAAPSEDQCPIYRHTHLKMVIDYLRAHRGPVTFYEAPCNVMVELVDEGPAVSQTV
jgi:hypothetical protein